MKFHHVAFTVKDIQESAKWYEEKLGFKAVNNYKKNGLEITLLQFKDIRIELISFGKDTKDLPNYRSELMSDIHTVGTKHLCLEVDNLDEFIDKLKAKRVLFVTKTDTAAFGGRYVFFKDCNNILIELYQR
ncbi:hypothetical protein A3C98_02890 [Candidatus Roizmanbacteria bacterium RIFCSPHIGHO2_02_FULL_37_15]|uniref:VOC domain-containing protein n=1 Tax=Candidatus Roizmanbacteria bacterium RIFCSPLOWO2_01_FULL_37_16 TaxID=1802058 RepID=A0A1F7IJW0_9BACT|nr:MAG: hypothetical protein A2859_02050 [Candidatus Roizmanbacteria bacterium RIFCSPHIGHO2_01_FULL_37_16b]OGK21945.1 MAG: hypothetical protein A3C98_02890 [Candidatus Roizmanbacteria bacterium RIFCSPHIGHO2_02_FULL_37_15]OGK32153.1 MAG: hypothetical protein A3F57_03725 [Candidatus Roizmanbacteria bacterium RIFCSPHIGHO2_12_FULL_36_11]OGK43652.1 MAG: hypothetical protein A3B40_03505 [Candidatus Roizmanbacteria bacterium RIFCSPLOWO2_01_FULL_37_16]